VVGSLDECRSTVAQGVDPTSDRPVYKQIADALRQRIEGGQLAPGERVPSEAQLVDEFRVAQGTIRQAVAVLRGEGLVIAEHGRGVFVRQKPKIRRLAHDRFARRHRDAGKAAFLAEAEKAHVTPRVDVVFVGEEPARRDVAELLGVSEGDSVLARRRRYFSDEEPTELASSFLPLDLVEGTPIADANPGPGGIYARLEESGHELARFTEEVSARMPTPDELRALQLAPGTPVLTLTRVAYDTAGRAVEVCDTVMSSDHYVLAYELPAT
jgi:GntR family transcriptional regulator